MKCPECESENIVEEQNEVYCRDCGLIIREDYMTVENNYDENSNLTIDDGLNLDVQMTNIEKKHNYRSRSYERYRKFKQRYYDIFEDVLLENGYAICDIPHIFYNCFRVWYKHNSKRIGNKKRIDVINWFLMDWEV